VVSPGAKAGTCTNTQRKSSLKEGFSTARAAVSELAYFTVDVERATELTKKVIAALDYDGHPLAHPRRTDVGPDAGPVIDEIDYSPDQT
jgi:hypothetical protein